MAGNAKSPHRKQHIIAIGSTIFFVVIAIYFLLFSSILVKFIAGLPSLCIGLAIWLTNFGNSVGWLSNILGVTVLWQWMQKIWQSSFVQQKLIPFYKSLTKLFHNGNKIGAQKDFFILYHLDDSSMVDEVIQPALKDKGKYTVERSPCNANSFEFVYENAQKKARHIVFALSDTLLDDLKHVRISGLNGQEESFKDVLLRLTMRGSGGEQRASAVFVRQSRYEIDLPARSFACISIYREYRASQKEAKAIIKSNITIQLSSQSNNGQTPPPLPGPPAQTQAPRVWTVPRQQTTAYVDRMGGDTNSLSSLQNRFERDRIQILYGLDGIGKTEIALAYAYKFGQFNELAQRNNPFRYVLWVDAIKSLRDGFEKLNVALRAYPVSKRLSNTHMAQRLQEEIVSLKEWLNEYEQQLGQNRRWLLVIDKCKKADIIYIQRIIMPSDKGDILFTMRDSPGDGLGHAERVHGMSEPRGALLLLRKITGQEALEEEDILGDEILSKEWNKALEVARELGGSPLAIVAAAAYIKKDGYPRFLKLYRSEYNSLRDHLQDNNDPLWPIVVTWHLLFKRIQKVLQRDKVTGAEEMLLLCALLDYKVIPRGIIAYMLGQDGLPLFSSEAKLTKALRSLIDLSLITSLDQGESYRLEKIVRDGIRLGYPNINQSVDKAEMQNRQRRVIEAVSAAFLNAISNKEEQVYFYLPHIEKCLGYMREAFGKYHICDTHQKRKACINDLINSGVLSIQAVALLHAVGHYLTEHPQYEQSPDYSLKAQELLEMALKMRRYKSLSVSETAYPDLPTCLNSMAELYYEQFQNRDVDYLTLAEDCFRKALDIFLDRQKQHRLSSDPRNVDEATLRNNLGRVLNDMRMYEKARVEFLKALRKRSHTLLSEVTGLSRIALLLNKADILNNLAVIYVKSGNQKMEGVDEDYAQNKHTGAEEKKRKARQHYRKAELLYHTALNRVLSEAKDVLALESNSPLKAAYERQRRLYELQLETNEATLYVCRGDEDRYEEARDIYSKANDELNGMIEEVEEEDGYIPPGMHLQLAMQWNNLMELHRIRQEFDEANRCYKKVHEYYTNYTGRKGQVSGRRHLVRFVIRDNVDELARRKKVGRKKVMYSQERKDYKKYRNEYLG